MAAIASFLVLSVLLIAGPIVASVLGHSLGGGTSAIMTISGIVMLLLAGIILTITKLYVKTKASQAFVRTGMGGMRVIKDGGALVIPVIHQIVTVPLRSFRLEVTREGGDALITKDKLRADIKAEFFVRVQPEDDSIKNAARSYGDHMEDERYVAKLVEDKLVSALRTAAAGKTLEELNTDRDSFVQLVTEGVTTDLTHNGLTLEGVTISKLDQTDPRELRDDNIFDAQGKRTIAEITQKQLTERNALERAGEQARTKQDVETRQQVLELERQRAEAEAKQSAEIAKIKAAQQQEAREKEIEADRQVELAEVEKAKQLEVAQRKQQEATEVAEQQKQKAVTEAEQQVEVAKRKQQEAIAQAEAERALKEAEQAEAEAKREEARQAIKTVEVTKTAERDAEQKVIAAKAKAEQEFVEAQRRADAKAYEVEKDADARQKAADADAAAVTKKAEAEANAKRLTAEGDKAVAMVPVDVEARKVEIEQQRVAVLQQELEARSQHGQVAQEFELAKIRIAKQAEVQIAAANAMATLTGKIEVQTFGTPEDVARMTRAFADGMGLSKVFDGFLAGANTGTLEAASAVANKLGDLAGAAATRLSGDTNNE